MSRYPLAFATGTYGTALAVSTQLKRDAPDAKSAPIAALPVPDLANRLPIVGVGVKMQRPVQREEAAPEAPATEQCTFFADAFAGSGDLSTHAPDEGGAYVSDGGSLAAATIDDGLVFGNDAGDIVYANSPLAQQPSGPYAMEAPFTIATAGDDRARLEIAVTDETSGNYLVDAILEWNADATGHWTLTGIVRNVAGDELSTDTVNVDDAMSTLEEAHALRFDVGDAGAVFSLDGAQVLSTDQAPDVPPDGAIVSAFTAGETTAGKVASVTGTSSTCQPVPVNPCTASGTQAMLDNFTGSGNLVDHASDSGATWTLTDATITNCGLGAYLVDGTVLRRPDVTVDENGSSSEAFAYPSQQPTTSHFYIEALIRFKGHTVTSGEFTDPELSFLDFYQHCDDPGNDDILCELSSQGLHEDAGLRNHATITFDTVPFTDYVMRLIVDGANLTLCVNGAVLGTSTLASPPTAPFGIGTFNFGGVDNFEIDYISIVDIA